MNKSGAVYDSHGVGGGDLSTERSGFVKCSSANLTVYFAPQLLEFRWYERVVRFVRGLKNVVLYRVEGNPVRLWQDPVSIFDVADLFVDRCHVGSSVVRPAHAFWIHQQPLLELFCGDNNRLFTKSRHELKVRNLMSYCNNGSAYAGLVSARGSHR